MKQISLMVAVLAMVAFLVSTGAQAASLAGQPEGPAVMARAATVAPSARKGGDGAACSTDDECTSGTCEGGSCCTAHGAACTASSHCCGHQSCTGGTCP